MYTPEHKMLVVSPPHGTQLVGNIDGTYMFIFHSSLKKQVVDWLYSLTAEAESGPSVIAVPSPGTTTAAPVQGKVLKGDVSFEFASPPAKLDETVHVDADVAEAMSEANKRGQHNGDTERPPATEPNNQIPV